MQTAEGPHPVSIIGLGGRPFKGSYTVTDGVLTVDCACGSRCRNITPFEPRDMAARILLLEILLATVEARKGAT